ncbi:hypothetical protein AALC17_13115 [Oscillospiraceae bacterium 38-13]
MDDKKMIQDFGDMVNATEALVKPWKEFVKWLIFALVATNLIWGFVLWRQIRYAYMEPVEITQEQLFDEHTQNQHYSSGATDGN